MYGSMVEIPGPGCVLPVLLLRTCLQISTPTHTRLGHTHATTTRTLSFGEYLLTATPTTVYHLSSDASDEGNHSAALAPSMLLDDLSGGCDCPLLRDCEAAWSSNAFEHCGHYLVGEFKLRDGRPALMIHNQVNATACKRLAVSLGGCVFTLMALHCLNRRIP